jgi:hypothetical protein
MEQQVRAGARRIVNRSTEGGAMSHRAIMVLLVGELAGAAWAGGGHLTGAPGSGPGAHIEAFSRAHPGARVHQDGQRVTKVYGRAFAHGATPSQSAASFLDEHTRMLGADPVDLVPAGPFADGAHAMPVKFDRATGTYAFTALYYTQARGGVPVYGRKLVLLVRNEAGFPLVLASSDLRDLGSFKPDPGFAGRFDAAAAQAAVEADFGHAVGVFDPQPVIWAGVDEQTPAPRSAFVVLVEDGADKWRYVIDAAAGAVLHREHLIFDVDVAGNVSGLTTTGIGAEQCEPEQSRPLPYLQVLAGLSGGVTDEDGNFVVGGQPAGPVTVNASLDGLWFNVFNWAGAELMMGVTVTPPAPANFLFNSANTDALVRAQVNGYVGANLIRDYVLQFNPGYPTLNTGNFEVQVNRTDFVCPGNAWYDGSVPSINFCQAGNGSPNTAWGSVIYHEYGHHLVAAGGSGQGAYGEGMGDVMSVLLLDSPLLGLGFFGDCLTPLRNADNTCQYSATSCTTNCGSESHACGRLIAGCVWDTRNELVVSEPIFYRDIISNLAINSILLHNGSSISPSITIDYLTLDDDDANIMNGTPHYEEIAAGFGAHNMDAPPLIQIDFEIPGGIPDLLAPGGDSSIQVNVLPVLSTPQPGTGMLHYSVSGPGGPYTAVPMSQVGANSYLAPFPAFDCGTAVDYYFSAMTMGGQSATFPVDAPESTFQSVAASSIVVVFEDDFQTNMGWTINNAVADGQWGRGVPVDCNRGDPPADADGSGQCYLTDNSSANNCNSDVDSGTTTLTSPTLDASGDNAAVAYHRWYSNVEGDGPMQDVFVIQVSDDNGLTWVNLESVGPAGPEVAGGWYHKVFNVASVVEPTSTFRIRFQASDTDPQSIVEAGVDLVQILSYVCDDPCTGDVTGDGQVNVQDLVAVALAWGSGDPGADVDGSGIVDVADLVGVVLAWGPCP